MVSCSFEVSEAFGIINQFCYDSVLGLHEAVMNSCLVDNCKEIDYFITPNYEQPIEFRIFLYSANGEYFNGFVFFLEAFSMDALLFRLM